LQRRHGEAEAAFRKAIDLKPDYPGAHLGLGLALMPQAQFHEAFASLKNGADLLPEGDNRPEWVQQRLQECQRFMTLDARLPRVLKGTENPANAAEQIEFARLCHLKKLHAAAAGFFAAAFAMKPQLAEDLSTSNRYDGACAAALAGCGPGADGAEG